MSSRGGSSLSDTVNRLMAEGRYYDAALECYVAGDDALMITVLPRLKGSRIEARVEEMRQRGAPREELVRLAQEAMLTDEIGMRVELGRGILSEAGVPEDEIRRHLAFVGRTMERRYHDTRRMRYFESAMKYFGRAGDRDSALRLARAGVDRFKAECGFVFINDALEGLREEARMPDEEIAHHIPEMGIWIPAHDRLRTMRWFDRVDRARLSEDLSDGDRIFDDAFAVIAGRPFSAQSDAIARMVARMSFLSRLVLRSKARTAMERLARTWGVEVGGRAAAAASRGEG